MKLLIRAALMSSVLLASAQAAVFTQQAPFSFGAATAVVNASGQAIHSRDDWLAFQYFDPAWGQLTAAHWELESALAAQAHATVWGNGQFATSAVLSLGAGVVTRVAGEAGLRGAPGLFLGGEQQQSASCTVPTDTWTCDIDLTFTNAVDGYQAASQLAELTGQGSFLQGMHSVIFVGASPDALTSMLSSGEYAWGDFAARNGVGLLRLVYEYEPAVATVSLPGALGLVLSALVVLVPATGGRRRWATPPAARVANGGCLPRP